MDCFRRARWECQGFLVFNSNSHILDMGYDCWKTNFILGIPFSRIRLILYFLLIFDSFYLNLLQRPILSIAFNLSELVLASLSQDNTLILYDLSTLEMISTWSPPSAVVKAFTFDNEGTQMYVGTSLGLNVTLCIDTVGVYMGSYCS